MRANSYRDRERLLVRSLASLASFFSLFLFLSLSPALRFDRTQRNANRSFPRLSKNRSKKLTSKRERGRIIGRLVSVYIN